MASQIDPHTYIHRTTHGELRLSVVHGRLHLAWHARNARVPVTVPIEFLSAKRLFSNGTKLIEEAQAARREVA